MNRLLSLFLFLLGGTLVALSGTQLWFALPTVIEERVCAQIPTSTALFQLATLVSGVFVAVGLKGFDFRRPSIVVASLAIGGLLFFPFFTMIAEPSLGARAAWLQMQHENLTWLGGDLSTSFEYRETGKELRTYVVDTPRAMRIVPLPNWSLTELEPSKYWQLCEWLGYGNSFCQFVRRGWIMAFVGMCCLWVSSVSIKGRARSRAVSLGLKWLGASVVLGCVAALTPPFLAANSVRRSQQQTARGDYAAAARSLDQACETFPALAHDTHLVAQRGLLDFHLHRKSPEAALHRANLLERAGLYAQASEIYEQLVCDLRNTEATRREACRAILRSAVHTLNSGAIAAAVRELRLVLDQEPTNLKALYCLQLAQLRQGNQKQLEESVALLHEVYSYYQFANKKVVLAEAERQRLQLALSDAPLSNQPVNETDSAETLLQQVRRPKR